MKYKVFGVAWLHSPANNPLIHIVADQVPVGYYQVTEAVEMELPTLSAADVSANRATAIAADKVAKLAKLQAEIAQLEGK